MPNVELVGIADENEFRGTQMLYKFKTKYFKDYKDLLNTDIDGVIICTNNKMYCQVSVDVAKAGKHILVEKPFAIDGKSAELMISTVEQNNVKIMNAFPMRFNSSVIEAKK